MSALVQWPTEAEFRGWVLAALSQFHRPLTINEICAAIVRLQPSGAPWAAFPSLAYYSSVDRILTMLRSEGLIQVTFDETAAGVSTYHYGLSILDRLARESAAEHSAGREAPELDSGGPGDLS